MRQCRGHPIELGVCVGAPKHLDALGSAPVLIQKHAVVNQGSLFFQPDRFLVKSFGFRILAESFERESHPVQSAAGPAGFAQRRIGKRPTASSNRFRL